jgi:stringent starvation protein B
MDCKESEKKQRLLQALGQGMVMVHLDARRPGVAVPEALKSEPHLRLNLSYRFDPPDLSVNEWGIRATLSFSGKRFTVAVPWSSLFAMTGHGTKEFWLYPEDMPKELIRYLAAAPLPEKLAGKRRRLQQVASKQESKQRGPRRGRGHLRVIK